MSRIKFICIILLLAGPFILVMNYRDTSENKLIDREGIKTLAVPTAKINQRGRKGSRGYKLEVQYPVEGLGIQTATVNVSHELYDKVESMQTLEIKYLKTFPSKLIIIGEPLESQSINYFGIGLFLVGIYATWYAFIRKNPEAGHTESSATQPRSKQIINTPLEQQLSSQPKQATTIPSLPDDDDRYKPPSARRQPPSNA